MSGRFICSSNSEQQYVAEQWDDISDGLHDTGVTSIDTTEFLESMNYTIPRSERKEKSMKGCDGSSFAMEQFDERYDQIVPPTEVARLPYDIADALVGDGVNVDSIIPSFWPQYPGYFEEAPMEGTIWSSKRKEEINMKGYDDLKIKGACELRKSYEEQGISADTTANRRCTSYLPLRGNKDYMCPVKGCAKVFTSINHLKKHGSCHFGKYLKCPRCEKMYSRKDTVLRHLKCLHGMSYNESIEAVESLNRGY